MGGRTRTSTAREHAARGARHPRPRQDTTRPAWAGVDLIVCGNAVRRTNVGRRRRRRRAPHALHAVTLAELFLAVAHAAGGAGTHGKTTSSSMLAWSWRGQAAIPAPHRRRRAARHGARLRLAARRGSWVEGETSTTRRTFDKEAKFLHYRPATLILTALEFDHADIYAPGHVQQAFRKLLTRSCGGRAGDRVRRLPATAGRARAWRRARRALRPRDRGTAGGHRPHRRRRHRARCAPASGPSAA